jgi:hypothetical protein
VRDHGHLLVNGVPSFPSFPSEKERYTNIIIGEKSMRVYLGSHRIGFVTGVSVFYAFDEDSKLIDIAVLKEIDSL